MRRSLRLLVLCLLPLPVLATEPVDQRHEQFLDDVGPLLLDEERAAFDQLERTYQRDAFVRRFWEVRDPYPETGRNELEERWTANLKIARSLDPTLGSDRALGLLFFGEPAERLQRPCPSVLVPIEVWRYEPGGPARLPFALVFLEDGTRSRFWRPAEGLSSLLRPGLGPSTEAALAECEAGADLGATLSTAADGPVLAAQVVPAPDPAWVTDLLDRFVVDPAGDRLAGSVDFSFPARDGERTIVVGTISLPTVQPGLGASEGTPYRLQLDGEILRRGELFESFRYRFELPVDQVEGAIPLVFERLLRPGDYQAVLRLTDLETDAVLAWESPLAVPVTPAAVAAAADELPPVTLRLSAPTGRLLTDVVRVEALVQGEGVDRVRFSLDGREVMSRRRPPYTVELGLGDAPRLHTVAAEATDDRGRVLARDEVELNTGPHRFAVRLLEPQPGRSHEGLTRVVASVEVPTDEVFDRLEIYVDDDLVGTLYQPPFRHQVVVPGPPALSWIRVLGFLESGSEAEDVALVNAPLGVEGLEVDLVELYTTVTDRKGHPIPGLSRELFSAWEGETEQEIVRFEQVDDVPLHAGVLIDTSTSMLEELEEAERAALRFFEVMIAPRDRAVVLTFNDHPELRVPFTNDLEVLAGGLVDLEAEGETALYDSLVFALYHFAGISGKRLLVLLSDGEDVGSRYDFDTILEFARRSGVAIYTIGLQLPSKLTTARHALLTLAEETGGRAFFVESAQQVDSVYEQIEAEVRSQYLIVYQSSHEQGDHEFRRVEVRVVQPDAEARTIPGYYP